jgi:hypothetical protein
MEGIMNSFTRREFLVTSGLVGTALVLDGCSRGNIENQKGVGTTTSKDDESKMSGEVTATEDLMREHGVLRRALHPKTGISECLLRETLRPPCTDLSMLLGLLFLLIVGAGKWSIDGRLTSAKR